MECGSVRAHARAKGALQELGGTRARNAGWWDDAGSAAPAGCRLRRDGTGHGRHRLPPDGRRAERPAGRGRGAAAHGPGHPALRQAPDDVVRARARHPVAGRGRGRRSRRRRRAHSQASLEGGMGRVRKRERALLAALRLPRQRRYEVEESLDELGRLAESAGAEVVGRVTQERQAPTPKLYFGKGKVDELKASSERERANLMISDDALSPIQERNLGGSLGL